MKISSDYKLYTSSTSCRNCREFLRTSVTVSSQFTHVEMTSESIGLRRDVCGEVQGLGFREKALFSEVFFKVCASEE